MPRKPSLLDMLRDDPEYVALRTNEARAEYVGAHPHYLQIRLHEAREVLLSQYRAPKAKCTFNADTKRLYLNNGYCLQWQPREYPDQPESYENQQTNTGNVELWCIDRRE